MCTVRPPASNAARSHHALDARPIANDPRRPPQLHLRHREHSTGPHRRHIHRAAWNPLEPTNPATSPPPATVLDLHLLLMMATTPGASRRAAFSSPYMPVAAHELRRQMSMPAALAVAATFASCGSGGGHGRPPKNLVDDDDDGGGGELRGRAPRPAAAGGVGAVVRALWAWITRGKWRRKVVVMSRTGSSVKEQQQYGHEEYAQNFDEGGAAAEPENLSRSFSARYARRAPWDDGARRRRSG